MVSKRLESMVPTNARIMRVLGRIMKEECEKYNTIAGSSVAKASIHSAVRGKLEEGLRECQ